MIHNKRVPIIDGLRVDEAHKGGFLGDPFGTIESGFKKATREVTRVGEQATKVGTAALAGATDPTAWMGYLALPGTGAGELITGQKATEAYQAMSQAEKDKYKAEAERRMAVEQERKAKLKQEGMVAAKAKAEAAKAKERAQRIGSGRRGLLFQGREQGVTGKSNVLGG